MPTTRIEAFSDAVIAILITIMVLELQIPHSPDLKALHPLIPVFLTYILSFINLALYWNNHHHLFHAAKRVNGQILWANLHLLFWLSLFTFFTGWMGENSFATVPTAAYGLVLFFAGVAYYILQQLIIAEGGPDSGIAHSVGKDTKGKISAVLYAVAVPLAFANRWIAIAIYVFVALMWLVPDRRLESAINTD